MTKHNEALATLQTKVADMLNSNTWKEALAFRKNFHQYSMTNVLLIWAQKPDATQVAGYRKWQELGRQVRKGEKSLAVLAPIIVKDKDSDDPNARKLVGFKTARVFDISQTDGDDIPTLPTPTILTSEHPETQALTEKFTS